MLNRRVNDLVQVPGSPEEQVHEALSGTQRFFVEGPTNCLSKVSSSLIRVENECSNQNTMNLRFWGISFDHVAQHLVPL